MLILEVVLTWNRFLMRYLALNKIQLIPVKVIGGVLAYLMIVLAPLYLHKLKLSWQLVYFYYVSFVMLMTYVGRIQGDFEGAEPFWFHYFTIDIVISCCFLFGWKIFKSTRN